MKIKTELNYLMQKRINLLKTVKKLNNFQLYNNNNNEELSLILNNQLNLSKQQSENIHNENNQQQKIKTNSLFNYWTNEYIDLLNIFEVYLLIIYEIYQKNQKNQLNNEKLHLHFDTIMLYNPSVYCDALLCKNENNNKIENLSNDLHGTKSINQYSIINESMNSIK
ncbi:hypothetical protein EWB00_010441 [Schistosoma japonicum]|uniref:Uncharacterized protein n=1 Tax=Schistosoma japonicum TaxID=6182 RepID=A0A4Z2DXP7_SCHJA|nr:hypothetical protein EWB00_010441 [Schistosoma japonicum]